MQPFLLLIASFHLAWSATIQPPCPENCVCQPINEHEIYLETACNNFEFIKNLIPQQVSAIVSLKMNNSSLTSVDTKLNHLKNLNKLDLSNNKITDLPAYFPYLPKLKQLNLSGNGLLKLSALSLPKNLVLLDVSNNLLSQFPNDLQHLKNLNYVNFDGNPIDCDCENIGIYELMIKRGIEIPETTCAQPKNFHGRPLSTVNCSTVKDNLLNVMLGDDGGSGDEPLGNEYQENEAPLIDDREDLLSMPEKSTEEQEHGAEEEEEGSGEGSGLIPIEEIPKACHINCSTPKPVGSNDDTDVLPSPGLKEQINTIYEDIFGTGETATTTSTTTSTESPTIPVTTSESSKEIEPIFVKTSDKGDVETFPTNTTVLTEMERASLSESNPQTIYIVCGLLLALAIFAAIYYVNKNRKPGTGRRRNQPDENCFGEEARPLEKLPEKGPIGAKPEEMPLINGKNGKITDDSGKDVSNGKTPEDVEIRKPTKEELLTPQLERVTIKSGELPDSIPKTPMLVHRELNNDGEFVTTVISK